MTALDESAPADFRAVDDSTGPAALIAALEEQARFPAVQRLRAAAIDYLSPRQGEHFLDVGCGLGDVARMLATRVGPRGNVVGIDASHTMVTEARLRSVGLTTQVEFRAGDATHLDLDDSCVDGAYCERVLQHLAAPEAAVRELARVTKPDGRIIIVDTDWGMHAVNGADPDLTATVLACWTQQAANGRAGRRLTELLARAGLRDPIVVAETITSSDPQQATRPPITTMAATAAHTGALNLSEAQRWLAQLAHAATQGHFFWAVTMFAVGASRKAGRS